METIGRILPNGKVEHEFHGQGFIYKNFVEFLNKTKEICYVPEYGESISDGYSYEDLLKLVNDFRLRNRGDISEEFTAEEMVENLFQSLDWQSPTTEIDQWEMHGTYDKE